MQRYCDCYVEGAASSELSVENEAWMNGIRCDNKSVTSHLLGTFYSIYLSGD